MADAGRPAVPGWFWAVAVLALIWEAIGCFAYVMQVSMDASDLAALPPAQRDLWISMPSWVTAAYAIAVWVGLGGAIALLLRKRWARAAFAVSLLGVVVQFGWTFLATPILSTIGTSAAAFPAFIALVAAGLLWFADLAAKRGWVP